MALSRRNLFKGGAALAAASPVISHQLTHGEVRKNAFLEIARRAQGSLVDFTQYTFPEYEVEEFHRLLCEDLEWVVDEIRKGNSPRLMVFAPPQHGKSELVSRRFPAWFLGHFPDKRVISVSWGLKLALDMSRDVQGVMETEEYRRVFPDSQIPGANSVTRADRVKRTGDHFELIDKRGDYRALGATGGSSGFPSDLLIIDDPYRNRKAANSKTQREDVQRAYEADFLRRTSKDAGIIIVNTRWHVEDLSGSLLDSEPDNWRVASYKAIAEENEGWRGVGDALCPVRKPLEHLEQFKANPYDWASQYQCDPVIEGGGFFRDEWIVRLPFDMFPQNFRKRIITVDTAWSDDPTADYTVFQLWGLSYEGKCYHLDQVRGQIDYMQIMPRLVSFFAKHYASNARMISAVYIEEHASGKALIPEIRKLAAKKSGIGKIPVIGLKRGKSSKKDRANDILGHVVSGNVILPEDRDYSSDLISEILAFDGGRNDDQVDAMVDGVTMLLQDDKPKRKRPKGRAIG